jgi:FkbM family methyltransferase
MTVLRPIAFVLAAANHGTMIVNRNDYRMLGPDRAMGVGFQLLSTSSFDQPEVNLLLALLELRHRHFGDGMMALDCGANIGVHTLEWARAMTGRGRVLAIEAQERIFYALAGNIALNNCFNASARHAAVGAACGVLRMPQPDYLTPGSYGSLELRPAAGNEFIGQTIDYSESGLAPVEMISIDSLALPRLDLLKLDVEGMEADALEGAAATLVRTKPVVLVEVIKSDRDALIGRLAEAGYRVFAIGLNLLAVHEADPVVRHLTLTDGKLIVA